MSRRVLHEEGNRQGEKPVLRELDGRDHVRCSPVVGRPELWIDARCSDVREEEGTRDPDRDAGTERREPVTEPGRERRRRDAEHGQVGERHVRARRAEAHREARLVVDVEEEQRERGREHERRR